MTTLGRDLYVYDSEPASMPYIVKSQPRSKIISGSFAQLIFKGQAIQKPKHLKVINSCEVVKLFVVDSSS